MQPTRFRSLHCFDARSLALFASLTMGGTHAIMAQSLYPTPSTPRSMHAPTSAAQPPATSLLAQAPPATDRSPPADPVPPVSPVPPASPVPPSSPADSGASTFTPEQAFDHADTNGDGKLSRKEAERYPSIAERFQVFDIDHNGSLSRDEFIRAMKSR